MAEYCLRWNNHQPNLVTVFSELLSAESLVDVTLATDGHFIHAHKLVLSACSAYFKDLFGSNPCKHPIVFLKDIRIEDLKTVIDFIYRGEVNVAQERLQDVLKTAESLRIKGLADKPFSHDEYPSQSRGQQPSSSFSSQRSSLTDSREQQPSVENEDAADSSVHSPPLTKKRKLTSSHDSSESVHDSNHDEDFCRRGADDLSIEKTSKTTTSVLEESSKASSPPSISIREKVKEEENGSEKTGASTTGSRAEYQESRAADAMLLLHGRSSEGSGEDGGATTPITPIARSTDSSTAGGHLAASHHAVRGKRGMLQRQTGVTREGPLEELSWSMPSSDYIVPDLSPIVTFSSEMPINISQSLSDSISYTTTSSQVIPSGIKMLQVPTVVVGTHPEKPHTYPVSFVDSAKKPYLVVPTSMTGSIPQITKQRSQPEMSRSYSEGLQSTVKKDPSVSSNLVSSINITSSPPLDIPPTTTTSVSSQGMTLIPMQLIKKQKSSPGSLPSSSLSLRPIQPKPPSSDKEIPIIQFTPIEEESSSLGRYTRAISEEPILGRSLDLLSPGSSAPPPLTQSVSQDTGMDSSIGFVNRAMPSGSHCLSVPKLASVGSSGTASTAAITTTGELAGSGMAPHAPVLRDGPALGCNFCWNSQDNHGRVQRRKTKYHCPACRTNLCIVPCFHEFHNQMQMQQDQNKQYAKILTKTSSS